MAIDASKFTDKDKLIAKFYTLRAGLSVIAEETDKIKHEEDKVKEACNEIDNAKKEIRQRIAFNEEKIQGLKSFISRNASEIKALEEKIEEARNPKLGVWGWILLCWLGFCGSFGIVSGIFADYLLERYNTIAVALIPAFFMTVGIYKIAIKLKAQKAENTVIKQYNKKIEELRKGIDNATNNISMYASENEKVSERGVSNSIVENFSMMEANFKKYILPKSIAFIKSVKQAMLQESNGVISEYDWQNLDLLIFYLENGRADSLKEAYQLVDKQRQTDQIVSSIREASYHISSAINAGFNRLGALISGCFSNLSKQIQSNHREISDSISSLERTVKADNREMSARINNLNSTIMRESDRMVNAQEINNALTKRAKDSSETLVSLLKENEKYW